MSKYHVCMDPGHGPGCANKSPDGSYEEQEFAMDLSLRIAALLRRHGVLVSFTRDGAGYPSLRERCALANSTGAALFVSVHSNAAAGSGWSTAAGHTVFTSEAGESAGRNRAARALLARWQEAGISLRGSGLFYSGFSVLTGTKMPAVLLEHGFHTNRSEVEQLKTSAFRQTLAVADAKGILDFLGLTWIEETDPNRAAVQARFGLEDGTMDYLQAYAYGQALLQKLATGG